MFGIYEVHGTKMPSAPIAVLSTFEEVDTFIKGSKHKNLAFAEM